MWVCLLLDCVTFISMKQVKKNSSNNFFIVLSDTLFFFYSRHADSKLMLIFIHIYNTHQAIRIVL